jgi:hypothetical protein
MLIHRLPTNDVGELSAGAAYYIQTPRKLSERQEQSYEIKTHR